MTYALILAAQFWWQPVGSIEIGSDLSPQTLRFEKPTTAYVIEFDQTGIDLELTEPASGLSIDGPWYRASNEWLLVDRPMIVQVKPRFPGQPTVAVKMTAHLLPDAATRLLAATTASFPTILQLASYRQIALDRSVPVELQRSATCAMGVLFTREGRRGRAEKWFARLELTDRDRLAVQCLHRRALNLLALGDTSSVIERLSDAIDAGADPAVPGELMASLHNVRALAHHYRGEVDDAVIGYNQALALLDEQVSLAATIKINLGGICYVRGEVDCAEKNFVAAAKAHEQIGDIAHRTDAMSNLAALYRNSGRSREAALIYQEILDADIDPIDQHADSRGRVLRNIGVLYSALGDPLTASEYLGQALEEQRAREHHLEAAVTTIHLADAYRTLNNLTLARQVLFAPENESLVDSPTHRVQLAVARANLNLTAHSDHDAALTILEPLAADSAQIPIAEQIEYHIARARGWQKRDPDEALGAASVAVHLAKSAFQPIPEIRARLVKSEVLLSTASQHFGYEIDRVFELIQEEAPYAIGPDLLLAWANLERDAVALKLLHLERDGQIRSMTALETVDHSRTRIMDRLQFRETSNRATTSDHLHAMRLLESQLAAGLPEPQAAKLRNRLRTLRFSVSPHLGQQRKSVARNEVADSIRQRLRPGHAIVNFFLHEKFSGIWIITDTGVSFTNLTTHHDRIHDVALKARYLLANPNQAASLEPIAQELSGLVLAGIEIGQYQRLMIAADSVTHFVPFAALRLGADSEALGEKTEIQFIRSIASVQRQDRPTEIELSVIADPAFSRSSRLTSLPATRLEAESLRAFVPSAILSLGDAASSEQLITALKRSEIVHIATHGYFDPKDSRLSGLWLAGGMDGAAGFLPWWDIAGLEANAKLVILNGCETGLGRLYPTHGYAGLGHALNSAGVQDVVSTQWKVADRAAQQFMVRVYEGLYHYSLDITAAVARAQREMSNDIRYRDPYYWAAYRVDSI